MNVQPSDNQREWLVEASYHQEEQLVESNHQKSLSCSATVKGD